MTDTILHTGLYQRIRGVQFIDIRYIKFCGATMIPLLAPLPLYSSWNVTEQLFKYCFRIL